MPRRALVEKRPYLLLSLLAAILYYYLQVSALPEYYLWPIKGSACAFLSIYAYLRHGSRDARMMAAAMAVAALADMGIEFDLTLGAALFFVFHVIALMLFLRHRGPPLEGGDSIVLLALLLGTPFVAWWLPYDEAMRLPVVVYALALGAMAAGAWASDFPRLRVAAGAILFVISDLLIFAEMGPLSGSGAPNYLIWPIYYFGQFLITVGVITTLRKRDPELRVVQGGR